MSLGQSNALLDKLTLIDGHLKYALEFAKATGRTSLIGSVSDVVRANKAAIKKVEKAIRIATEQLK